MICKFKESISIKTTLLLLLTLLVSGCSILPRQQNEWRQNWPELSYYEAQYAADAANQAEQSWGDYIRWVERYYKGYAFYREGWDWLTETVLEGIEDDAQQRRLKEKMFSIGQKISAEWAKEDDHRQINSRHLLLWADAVKHSIKTHQEEVLADKILLDVDALLAGTLEASDVRLARYFDEIDGGDDEFDDFADDEEY